ncbi:MAG: class I SAM-dependent methyltransferase [Candidatus Omnitrophica bacterium]|nr:class I SAM-dependent methyltransferase [Candidatus Omnitrophota bacterium]
MKTKIKKGVDIEIKKKLIPFAEFHSPSKAAMKITASQAELVREFNRKVTDGLIEYETVECLCGARAFDLLASADRYAMIQDSVVCTKCGLIQSNPRMTEEELRRFYSSDLYRRCYEGDDYLDTAKFKYDTKYGYYIFDEIRKVREIVPGMTIVELGAGGGWNLVPFRDAGAKVLGVEYSPSLVKFGRDNGMEMVQGDITNINGTYDVVILNHVFEHMLNPVSFLKKLTKHLDTGSVVYIAVPNIMNFGMLQLQNAHTYYFSPETLEYFCSLGGLEMVKRGPAQKIHMYGIFRKVAKEGRQADLGGHYKKMRRHIMKSNVKFRIKSVLRALCLK